MYNSYYQGPSLSGGAGEYFGSFLGGIIRQM